MNAGSRENVNMKRTKELVEKYFHQLTSGCGRVNCDNQNCASNRNFKKISKEEAAVISVRLASQRAPLCNDNSATTTKPTTTSTTTTTLLNKSPSTTTKDKNISKSPTKSTTSFADNKKSTDLMDTSKKQSYKSNTSSKSSVDTSKKMRKIDHDEEDDMVVDKHPHDHDDDDDDSDDGGNNDEKTSRLDEYNDDSSNQTKTLTDQFQDAFKFITKLNTDKEKLEKLQKNKVKYQLNEDRIHLLVDKYKSNRSVHTQKLLLESIENCFQDLNSLSTSFRLSDSYNKAESKTIPSSNLFDIDFDSIRRSYDKLMSLDICHDIERCLNNAVNTLCNVIKLMLTHKKDLTDHEYDQILHSLVIVNELPLIENPTYFDSCANAFYLALAEVPDKYGVKLVRLWSKWSSSELESIVYRIKQYITLHIISKNLSENDEQSAAAALLNPDNDQNTIHKCPEICAAVNCLRYLYYASIFGGRLDQSRIIDVERKQELDDIKYFEQANSRAGGSSYDQNEEHLLNTLNKLDPLEELLNIRIVDCRQPKIPHEVFIHELANKYIHIQTDYIEYRQQQQALATSSRTKYFSFLSHPYFLTLSKKNLALYYDNKVKMLRERRNNIMFSLLEGIVPVPYIKIKVRRNNVLAEALNLIELQEEESPSNLRKQLYVEFENEQGIDEGGVSKEFFQLAIDELLNKGFTFFTYDENTRFYWFNPCTLESDKEFKLLGTLFGIAIYNNVLLDLQFPPVFFRKLMGKTGTFEDLKESHPVVYRTLKELLEYDKDDFKETFLLTFERSVKEPIEGNLVSFPLKENGANIEVTLENKQEYVDLYVDHILNKGIEEQFSAFRRGFLTVTRNSPLSKWYSPEELEILLCGTKVLDWQSLESATSYDGGYNENHPTIRTFWSVFYDFDDEQKKLFLKFTTGTDRCPHGGLSELKLTITRSGPDTEKLPTAHTCFNVLILPDYSSKQKLREKLLRAIEFAHGFGLS